VARLRELFRTSDQLAAQADTAGPAQLAQLTKQLDDLSTQFKQITSASIPLSKQSVIAQPIRAKPYELARFD